MNALRSQPNSSDKLTTILMYVSWILIVIVFAMNLWSSISNPQSIGDEGFYLHELERMQNDGLWTAFSDGISHLFMSIWYLISLTGIKGLVGMRLLNVLLAFLSLYIIYRLLKMTIARHSLLMIALTTAAYVLFLTKTGTMYYRAVNDPLMITIGLMAILFLSLYFDHYRIKHLVMAAVFSGMMFWVRSFSLLIFGGIFFSVVMIPLVKDHKRFLKHSFRSFIFLIVFVVVMISVQIPSIIENQRLSFENKNLSGDWGARNWITRVERKPAGSIFAYERSSWEYVDSYIEEHGKDSVPISFVDRIITDPKFMIDNLASNLFVRAPYILLVSIGILGIGLLSILRVPERWVKVLSATDLLYLAVFFSVGLGVSLVIINYVEHRWLFMPVITGLVLGVKGIENMSVKLQNSLMSAQALFLIFFSAASIARLFI